MRISPYLSFNGQCEEAFRLYESCLRGTISFMMTYGDSPIAEQTPPEFHKWVMHVTLEAGGQVLQGADALPQHYQKPRGISVSIDINGTAEAERIFAVLAEGGAVQMPLQQTFWALRFGMVIDRFGIPWLINCGNPGGS